MRAKNSPQKKQNETFSPSGPWHVGDCMLKLCILYSQHPQNPLTEIFWKFTVMTNRIRKMTKASSKNSLSIIISMLHLLFFHLSRIFHLVALVLSGAVNNYSREEFVRECLHSTYGMIWSDIGMVLLCCLFRSFMQRKVNIAAAFLYEDDTIFF